MSSRTSGVPANRSVLPKDQNYLGGDVASASNFLLKVDGKPIGLFKEVSGLQVQMVPESIIEGGQNAYVHQVPTRMTYSNIVFKRGLTDSDAMYEWFLETSGETFASKGNKLTRRTGAIVAVTYAGKWLREWALEGLFPIRWKGPDFGAGSEQTLEEELEIAHHGFRPSTASKAANGGVKMD